MNKKGFTLIEILIVISFLAVICGFSLPGMAGFYERISKEGRVMELIRNIKLARNRAINEGRKYYLEISAADNAYYINVSEQGKKRIYKKLFLPGGARLISDMRLINLFPDGSVTGGDIIFRFKKGAEYRIRIYYSGDIEYETAVYEGKS